MEKSIKEASANMVRTIRESEVYRHYLECADALNSMPGVLDRVMELRAQTIDVYHGTDSDDFIEKSDHLAELRDERQKIPEVDAFLEAEEELVHTLQEVSGELSRAIRLYIPYH